MTNIKKYLNKTNFVWYNLFKFYNSINFPQLRKSGKEILPYD